MIIGQENICHRIDNLDLDSFPKSLMLVGERGAGKHLIVDYISEKLKIDLKLDITETLDNETIDEIYNRVEPYIYIIRVNEITVKEENTILKFLEEPLNNSYIILLAETENGILDTILNRCQIWYLQKYKRDYLRSFIEDPSNEIVLEVASTPGQVKELLKVNYSDMFLFADKIIDKISIASIPNLLTVSSKFYYKDSEKHTDEFNFKLFIDVLVNRIANRWIEQDNRLAVEAYKLTHELKKDCLVKNVDTKSLFENYLLNLRSIMRGGSK